MKYYSLILLFLLPCQAHVQELPDFKPLRYNEDYSFLKEDTNTTWYKKTKYATLSTNGDKYVSFGGEVRYQYFYIKNEDWGAGSEDRDGFVFSRYLAHTDWHLSKAIRVFTQLQSSIANNKTSGTSAVDENPLELHQAFIDIANRSKTATFRLGRQEFSYGSQRLVATRELPNNRQAFDAAKLIFKHNTCQVDAFFSRYVKAQKGIFDDASDKGVQFWGVYTVLSKILFLQHADVYYLGIKKETASFEEGIANERRHSVGSRIWGTAKLWNYDFEGLYQFGRFGNKKISAWTLSLNTTYSFASNRWRPEIGLKTELISGDGKKADNKLETFNPLFPRGAYFGLAALIGPSNLFDIHPSLSLQPVRNKLEWSLDYDVFWRYSKADGIYSPNVTLIIPAGNSSEKLIGHQFSTDLTYTPNSFLLFRIEGTFFQPGSYLKGVSPGKSILFAGATTQFKF